MYRQSRLDPGSDLVEAHFPEPVTTGSGDRRRVVDQITAPAGMTALRGTTMMPSRML